MWQECEGKRVSELIFIQTHQFAAPHRHAVREALNALAEEGFIEADLDQIGMLTEVPEEEPHASAYQGALEGEVAIIRFR